METKTHWKKLTNPTYLGSWDFEEKEERVVTIDSVTNETVKNHEGKDEEVVLMCFKHSKPLILNKTNLKATEKACGSSFIEEWAGKKITLYVARIKAFGEMTDALRVSPQAPKPPKKPTINDDRFENALVAVQEGKFTNEQLKAKYALTKKQLERL